MTDTFKQVTGKSWFARLWESIKSMVLGVLMFLAAFVVLFWNEGRAVVTAKSLAEGAKVVLSVDAGKIIPQNENKLVHFTGMAATADVLRDPLFPVSAPALKLQRSVEMYQWVEDKKSETHKKLGGGEETTTTYTYNKKWSESWNDASRFNQPAGHNNPPKAVDSNTQTAPKVTVGAFELSPGLVGQIHASEPLPLPADAPATLPDGYLKSGLGYYRGANPDQPQVGDLRVTFNVVKPQDVSVIAQQAGATLRPYATAAGRNLEMLSPGNHSAAEMFQEAQTQNAHLTWILRLVGFLVMWFGLMLVLNPFKILADFIPFFGSLVGAGLMLVTLVVALPLSLLTIAVAWFAFRPLLSIGLVALAAVLVVGLGVLINKRKPKAAAPAAA